MDVAELIEFLKDTNPELADKIIAMQADLERDGLRLTITESFTLEKFDGEYDPEKEPVEVIEIKGALPNASDECGT